MLISGFGSKNNAVKIHWTFEKLKLKKDVIAGMISSNGKYVYNE